jgi:hypothetical protein
MCIGKGKDHFKSWTTTPILRFALHQDLGKFTIVALAECKAFLLFPSRVTTSLILMVLHAQEVQHVREHAALDPLV